MLKGCTVDDYATIGDGSVIQEGAYVEVREHSNPTVTLPLTPTLAPNHEPWPLPPDPDPNP